MIDVYYAKKEKRKTEELIGVLLSERLGERPDPAEWEIGRTERGKPVFVRHPEVFFSVSDFGPWWVCAVAGQPVGVDLDGPRRRGEESARLKKVAERFFTPEEAAYAAAAGTADRFFHIWTAKEAAAKLSGQGIDGRFGCLPVLPAEFMKDTAEGGSLPALPAEWKAGRLRFQTLEGLAGTTLTVCSRKKEKAALRELLQHERFMREAILQAEKAKAAGDVPIGCVIVRGGEIIARGYNRRTADRSTLAHAELTAVRRANRVLEDWRLEGCRMYVTLEPCPMCAGALVQSRIDEVVIGCRNPKAGSAGSVVNLLQQEGFNHRVKITEGVLTEECSGMLSAFFRNLRKK